MHHSNLEYFLNCTTPAVRSRLVPKPCLWNLNVDWELISGDRVEYFNLGDLWDCYDEWSAYGVGSQIHNHGEMVVQYYTPYLSAIQIYTARPISPRNVGDDCDGEFEIKSWSSESEGVKLSRSSSSSSDKMWDMEDLSVALEDHRSVRDRVGDLYFEHFEIDGPFGRIPLKDKVDQLSVSYPGLKALNSIDLSPASWMAVAWYPIYQIPARRNARELYASFLTYHRLSSFQEATTEDMDKDSSFSKAGKMEMECEEKYSSYISLPPFGLATYRMQRKIWLSPGNSDHERISSLRNAADSWLKQLHVQHHDFNFFVSHSM